MSDVLVLEQARQLIVDRGWGQGLEVCNDGRVCAIGAVLIALGGEVKEFLDENGKVYRYGDANPHEFDRTRFYVAAPGQGDMPPWGTQDEVKFNNAGFRTVLEGSPRQRYRDVTSAWRNASGFNGLEKILDRAVEDVAADLVGLDEEDEEFGDRLDVTAGVVDFNDSSHGSQARVLAVFDRAIELATIASDEKASA